MIFAFRVFLFSLAHVFPFIIRVLSQFFSRRRIWREKSSYYSRHCLNFRVMPWSVPYAGKRSQVTENSVASMTWGDETETTTTTFRPITVKLTYIGLDLCEVNIEKLPNRESEEPGPNAKLSFTIVRKKVVPKPTPSRVTWKLTKEHIPAKSRMYADGKAVAGSLPDLMSWPDIPENILATVRSNADCANEPLAGQTIFRCIWRGTWQCKMVFLRCQKILVRRAELKHFYGCDLVNSLMVYDNSCKINWQHQ